MNAREEMFLGPRAHLWAVTLATAEAYLKRVSAYLIELIRWPLGPLFTFATWRVTYEISGRSQVDGATASGFLLIGIFGLITWTSTVFDPTLMVAATPWPWLAAYSAAACRAAPGSRTTVVPELDR